MHCVGIGGEQHAHEPDWQCQDLSYLIWLIAADQEQYISADGNWTTGGSQKSLTFLTDYLSHILLSVHSDS